MEKDELKLKFIFHRALMAIHGEYAQAYAKKWNYADRIKPTPDIDALIDMYNAVVFNINFSFVDKANAVKHVENAIMKIKNFNKFGHPNIEESGEEIIQHLVRMKDILEKDKPALSVVKPKKEEVKIIYAHFPVSE